MAKQMLSNLLMESLGRYVEGLSPENLKVGVFSGVIEQNDLVLKPTALSELQLPINVQKGSLKSLKLTIPWTSLESKPVKVDIDGIYLQAGPLDLKKMSQSELKKLSIAYKQNQLNSSEEEFLARGTSNEDAKSQAEKTSFMQSLAVKIVDNLELTLTNIHIRYEDSTSIPGKTIAAGLTIPSIILRTTDENWKDAYTIRKEGHNNCIRKLGQMKNFGVYWNNDDSPLSALSQDKWELSMSRLIYRDSAISISTSTHAHSITALTTAAGATASISEFSKVENMKYVLIPSSHYTVKLIHFEQSTSSTPKLDVILETSGVLTAIDKTQFSQISTVAQTFALLDRQKRMAIYRPKQRPIEKPREWWKYAYRVVMGKDFTTASKITVALKCFRLRRPYMDLVKKRCWEKENVSNGVEVPKTATFAPEDDARLCDIEDTLPIHALTQFRKDAVREFLNEKEAKKKAVKTEKNWFGGTKSSSGENAQKEKETSSSSSSSSSSFFSSMFRSKKTDAAKPAAVTAAVTAGGGSGGLLEKQKSSQKPNFEDDDFLIVEQFESQVNAYNSSVGDEFPLRFKFNFGIQFNILANNVPILSVRMEMNSAFEMRRSGQTAILTIDNLSAEDLFTNNCVEKFILRRTDAIDAFSSSTSSATFAGDTKEGQELEIPLSLKYISSSSGQSSLNVALLPLEIVSNEPCINMLYRIFGGSKAVEGAAVMSNEFIVATMEKYTKETLLAAVGSMDVDIVVYAPKIVLIKDPLDRQSSCLVIDCGSLVVKGSTSPLGTVMSVDLQQVNMNLPHSLSERFSTPDSSDYIVTPFSVSLKYNDADKTDHDSQVMLEIERPMSFSVNFSKMRELLLIVKTVEKTLDTSSSSSSLSSSSSFIDDSDNGLSLKFDDILVHNKAEGQASKVKEASTTSSSSNGNNKDNTLANKLNPNKKLMLARVSLASISFKVLGDAFSFIFNVGNLNLSYLRRPYDSSAEFSLEYVSLTDSSLDGFTKYLLSSSSDAITVDRGARSTNSTGGVNSDQGQGGQQRLVHVTYVDVTDSSLSNLWTDARYQGYKKIANIEFAVLNAHVDTLTLKRFGYLCKETKNLMDFLEYHTLQSSSRESVSTVTLKQEQARLRQDSDMKSSERRGFAFTSSTSASGGGGGGDGGHRSSIIGMPYYSSNSKEAPTSTTVVGEKDKIIGMKIDMSLKSVSLELFHVYKDFDETILATLSEAHFLEKAFAFSISGLNINYDAPGALASVGLSLDSITIEDTRAESSNFAYRQLICKSAVGVEFSTSSGDKPKEEEGRVREEELGEQAISSHDKLIYLNYRQSDNECNVDLNFLTFFMNVESLVSLTTVGLDISNALTAAVSCFDATDDESQATSTSSDIVDAASGGVVASNSIKTETSALTSSDPLRVSFKMNNPRIIFLEDPLKSNSRAVVAQCDFEVIYVKAIEGGANFPSQIDTIEDLLVSEKVLGNLFNFEVFILSGMLEGRPEQIVDPTGCSIELSKTSLRNVDLNMNLGIRFLPFHAKVSFSDIHMTNFILSSVEKKFQVAQASKKVANKSLNAGTNDISSSSNTAAARRDSAIFAARNQRKGSTIVTSKSKKKALAHNASSLNSNNRHRASSAENVSKVATVYDFKFNLDVVNITIINDFDVHATPLFRTILSDTIIDMQGTPNDIIGEASLKFTADYFNSRPSVWEPIVEPWIPKAIVEFNSTRLHVDISNDQRLQVNVSGSMAKNLLHFFKLLGQHNTMVGEDIRLAVAEDISTELETAIESLRQTGLKGRTSCGLIFVNELGVPCKITDHVTKMDLCDLAVGAKLPVSDDMLLDIEMARTGENTKAGLDGFKRSRLSNVPLPKYYNLSILKNPYAVESTLQQLPLVAAKARRYTLQKVQSPGSSSPSTSSASVGGEINGSLTPVSPTVATKSTFISEPVYDDVFENERWQLLGGWGEPWSSLGDPGTWSTASKGKAQHYKKVALPNENWEWIGDWQVDLNGVIGKEIDKYGWEYATSFDSFNVSRKRRAHQNLDSVRRRRWIRARQLKSNRSKIADSHNSSSVVGSYSVASNTVSNRPYTLFWDVKLMQNGTRFIYIRSSFEVVNILPFKIVLQLCLAENVFIDFGPINEGESLHLPLQYSHALSVRIRPQITADIPYQWSENIDCSIKFDDKRSTRQDVRSSMICEVDRAALQGNNNYNSSSSQSTHLQPVAFKCNLLIHDKELRLCLLPICVIRNLLPSKYLFKVYSDKEARDVHSGSINPGEAVKIFYLRHPAFPSQPYPFVSIQLGGFMWSAPIAIINTGNNSSSNSSGSNSSGGKGKNSPVKVYNLNLYSPSSNVEGVSLTMRSEIKPNGVHEISIYSSHALQDRTGLDLVVMSRRFRDKKEVDMAMANQQELSDVSEFLERKTYHESGIVADDSLCWAEGAKGIVLFQSVDEEVKLGVDKGTIWAKKSLKLSSMAAVKTVMEIVDSQTDKGYQLAYTLAPMPRAFACTQLLKVMPWYTIVNCVDDDVLIFQAEFNTNNGKREQEPLVIPEGTSAGWHKNSSKGGTGIRIQTRSSKLSLGCIDINCIGSTLIMLPQRDGSNDADTSIVLRVEVKLAETSDDSYITAVIWREYASTDELEQASIAVKNNTMFPVTIRQDLHALFANAVARNFEICIPAQSWAPFAWADPGHPLRSQISFGTNVNDNHCINLDLRGTSTFSKAYNKKDTGLPEGEIIKVEVSLVGGGQIVSISQVSQESHELSPALVPIPGEGVADMGGVGGLTELSVSCFMRSIGLSLVAERPIRRELMSICVDGIDAKAWQLSNINSDVVDRNCLELKVMDIQVDNYSESVVYPVMLHSFDSPERKKFKDSIMRENRYKRNSSSSRSSSSSGNKTPKKSDSDSSRKPTMSLTEYPNFLHMTLCRQQLRGSNVPMVKYLEFRMLEFKLEVDSSTLMLFALDLYDDLTGNSSSNPLFVDDYRVGGDDNNDGSSGGVESLYLSIIGHESKNIIHKRNEWCLAYQQYIIGQYDSPLVNFNEALKIAQAHKTHFESIVIHPLKMKISFCLTDIPRSSAVEIFPLLPWIRGIFSLKDFVIKVKSFQSENVIESISSLISRIEEKTISELKSQHAQITGQYIGSLDIIGRPADFSKKIGDGVKDLWYEPAQAAMHGPDAFIEGLGRGTVSFVGNVVGGTLTSAANIVNSATSTLTKVTGALTGDQAYVKKLEEKRRVNMVAGGGMLSGLENGAESFVGGIASGLVGLVTKPIEEGRKGGALGVAKGLGMGIVGLVTKPVMGITEGISNIAQGATNQMSDVLVVNNQRPPRAFIRSVLDENELVLCCMHKEATDAQATVMKVAKAEGHRNESFFSFTDLGFKDNGRAEPSSVVITKLFVYFLKLNGEVHSKISFGDISHFEFLADVLSVRLVVYQRNIVRPDVTIPCYARENALELYDMLYRSSARMGNPSLALPVEVVSGYLSFSSSSLTSDGSPISGELKMQKKPLNYRFGLINHIKFRGKDMPEEKIIDRAEESFMNTGVAMYAATIEKVVTEGVAIIDVESILFNGSPSGGSRGGGGVEGGEGVAEAAEKERKYFKIIEVNCLQLLYEWRISHDKPLQSSRCCLLLLINRSSHPVQILRTEMKEGKKSLYLATKTADGRLGYSDDSRVIASDGGVVVFFGFGFNITPFNLGHVKATITTGAGDITISTRPTGGASCKSSGDSSVGFMEKYVSELWCKFVVLIS